MNVSKFCLCSIVDSSKPSNLSLSLMLTAHNSKIWSKDYVSWAEHAPSIVPRVSVTIPSSSCYCAAKKKRKFRTSSNFLIDSDGLLQINGYVTRSLFLGKGCSYSRFRGGWMKFISAYVQYILYLLRMPLCVKLLLGLHSHVTMWQLPSRAAHKRGRIRIHVVITPHFLSFLSKPGCLQILENPEAARF